jgi:hypothetical protein
MCVFAVLVSNQFWDITLNRPQLTSQLFPAKLMDITDNVVQTDALYFIPTTQTS